MCFRQGDLRRVEVGVEAGRETQKAAVGAAAGGDLAHIYIRFWREGIIGRFCKQTSPLYSASSPRCARRPSSSTHRHTAHTAAFQFLCFAFITRKPVRVNTTNVSTSRPGRARRPWLHLLPSFPSVFARFNTLVARHSESPRRCVSHADTEQASYSPPASVTVLA